jgi:hypothetical protein
MIVSGFHIHSNHSVNDSQSSIEGKLCDLRSRELAIGVSEGDHRFIVLSRVRISAHAVESGFPDGVFHGIGVVQVNCLGDDRTCRNFGGIVGKDKGSELVFGTDLRIDIGGIADSFLDLNPKISRAAFFCRGRIQGTYLSIVGSVFANQFFIRPFKNN